MEPTPELIKALRRDKIESARQMSPQQRIAASGELFDSACEVARAGIRMQHPDADEPMVLDLLRQRISIGQRTERTRVLELDHVGRH